MAARSKALVCCHSPAWIEGCETRVVHEHPSQVADVCCQVEVSAMGRSLVQGSPTVYVCVSVIVKPR